jgi:hypothetical protein
MQDVKKPESRRARSILQPRRTSAGGDGVSSNIFNESHTHLLEQYDNTSPYMLNPATDVKFKVASSIDQQTTLPPIFKQANDAALL